MPKTTARHRLPLVFAVLLSGCLIAACGSSSSSSSSTTAVAAAGGPPSTASRTALRTCLRQHGVRLPARPGGSRHRSGGQGAAAGAGGGPPAGGAFFGGGGSRARFRNNPKLAAAFKACGGRAFPRRRFSLSHSAVSKFVACVRQHGYNMPNPNFSGNGPIFPASIRTNSKFQTASRSCAKLLFPRPSSGQTSTNSTS
jgi:hypothetical protein